MPRPPDQAKRIELARRAVEVMQREGVDVPMSRLAEALGIKRPTLLYHFPTRGHIAETALEDLLTQQAHHVLARIERHEHPIDRLYAQVKAVHEFHHGNEGRIVFLSQAVAASAGRMPQIIEVGNRVFEAHRRAAAERIRQGIAEGIVAPCDPEALVSLARAITDGLMVQRVMTGLELRPVHEFFWAHVLRPLKRPLEET